MRVVAQRGDGTEASLTACLASLLELGDDGGPRNGAPAGLDAWQEWLAPRNLRVLVTAALPGAGFWIARDGDGRHAVMFGTPPGVFWDPAREAPAGAPVDALALVALDPALPVAAPRPAQAGATGVVEGVFVAPRAEAPMEAVGAAEAEPGRGLRGDRYATGQGTFSARPGSGRALTLVAAEALEALEGETGIALAPRDARRNVVTRGLDLNALVGARLRIGEVECEGVRWCEPCAVLERLTERGVLRGLVHRGGLRADILTAGTLRIGDAVTVLG